MDLPSGAPERLGKYEIRGVLGRGAMGIVYDGWDPAIGRRVAIKTVPVLDQADPEAQEGLARFKREAQAAGRLSHPNIVGVYDYGETATNAYIVMEFIDGQSLKARLDAGERFGPDETVRIMAQVLAGLQFSHDAGIVHRDIKPGNVMLTADGRVKLADFGIARIESSTMTQDGSIIGTPAYMSPEQLLAQGADARSDIYAAGVVLYQLLSGERPFEGGLAAITHKALNTVPPKPSDISIAAPPALDAVVARAMSRRPSDRFARADAFAQALAAAWQATQADPPPAGERGDDATRVLTAPGPAARKVPTARPGDAEAVAARPRGRGWRAGVALAAALLAAGGGWLALRKGGTPEPARSAVASSANPAVASPTAPLAPAASTAPVEPAALPGPASSAPPPTTTEAATAAPAAPPSNPAPAAQAQASADAAPSSLPPPVPVALPPAAEPPVVAQPSVTPPADRAAPGPPTQEAAAEPITPPPPPVPPATVTPSVLQTPAPPPTALPGMPPPDLAALRDGLAIVRRDARCALAQFEVSEKGHIDVAGLVGDGAQDALHAAVQAAAAAAPVAWNASVVHGPFCDVIDLIRPIAVRAGSPDALGLTLKDGVQTLRDNDPIAPVLHLPDFASHLQVDYLSSDGSVTHLYPSRGSPERALPAGTTVALREQARASWAVGPPFGTDMIIAIASHAPLFTPRRLTDNDTVQSYVPALRAAIEAMHRKGERMSGTAIALVTEAR